MTDPIEVAAQAPCINLFDSCEGHTAKHPECAVAALKAAGALMPDEGQALTEQLRDREMEWAPAADMLATANDELAALLQEALSVLGRHKCGFGVVFGDEEEGAALAEKIEKATGGEG